MSLTQNQLLSALCRDSTVILKVLGSFDSAFWDVRDVDFLRTLNSFFDVCGIVKT